MESIRNALTQVSAHLSEHPEAGTSADAPATAVLEDGLRFRVDGPGPSVITDMPNSVGGGASTPSPGWFMRAALASCDATLVAMEAARDGIELTDLEVQVDSESDFRGVLGVDERVLPGPSWVRIAIRLSAANATDEQLHEIVARAESRSPVRSSLTREMPVTTEVTIGSAAGAVA